jgi:tetratricopeptide (TPR) repeat protein
MVEPALQSRTTLTVEERLAKQRLLVRDTVALSSLLMIVLALSFVTYLLFHSFAGHRNMLEQRWRQRGETALANGRPLQAIESLRSALAYSPDDRGLQIELATALANAGRVQEAVVYFNTLHETQPGDGMINLQLARLARRQNNAQLAIDHYQAALDGTWNGDGTLRRREVRLELARYLIEEHRYDEARNHLLIAAGNAADNHLLQLTVAGLLEQAEGDSDAFELYRKAAAFRGTRTAGLIGEGRTAAAESRYLLARNVLNMATQQPDFSHMQADEQAAVHKVLDQANTILLLFPAQNLPPRSRAVRVRNVARIAEARLAACLGTAAGAASAPAPGSGAATTAPTAANGAAPGAAPGGSAPASTPPAAATSTVKPVQAAAGGALRTALGAVQRAGETLAGVAPTPAKAAGTSGPQPAQTATSTDVTLAALNAQWQQLPQGPAFEKQLEDDPDLLESVLQLAYQTEKTTAQLCGAPTGEDALLLKIADAPDAIEQQ